MNRLTRTGLAALCVSLVLTITSCASDPQQSEQSETGSDPMASVSSEGFSGPYATEFAYNSSIAPTEEVRQILSDSEITEAEFSTVLTAFKRCASDLGYEIRDYKFDGSYGVDFKDGEDTALVNSRINDCSKSTGEAQVGSLYSWINRNPERLNESEIVAECLVKSGAVDNGFTAADYDSSVMNNDVPFLDPATGGDTLEKCQVDPLGIGG